MVCSCSYLVFLQFVLAFVTVVTLAEPHENHKLLGVAVLFRHGDRAPIRSWPTDPYYEKKYWPEGFGQLTKQGKRRQYNLGTYLRERYANFLPAQYSVDDIHVLSSDVDRTIMSAGANLAGLYPPTQEEMFVDTLSWHPIPIHTLDRSLDTLISVSKPCAKFERLYQELCASEEFSQLANKYSDFYKYISEHTTWEITDLTTLRTVYTTTYVYQMHNASYLPNWYISMSQDWKDLLRSLAGLSFSRESYTRELQRFTTGPFFNYLISQFVSILDNNGPKFLMFSGHDGTVSSILNTLGAYDQDPPQFASTIIFELFEDPLGEVKVNVYHKSNSTADARGVTVNGCEFDCEFERFQDLLAPITVNDTTREQECIDIPY